MALLLGIDTGGTYTDAVLIREGAPRGEGLIASAKALTTRRDLAEGVGSAMSAVLAEAQANPSEVALVALSTTLATNALVEGQGGRVLLISIGFAEAELARHGLPEALGSDPHLRLGGGHKADGGQAEPLDLVGLEQGLAHHGGAVDAVAVAGMFSVRNPEHEIIARDMVRERTGLPVTCGHELSSGLGGPRRAVTAVLNARLIALIDHLIEASARQIAARGISAPLMVVRGDGALMAAELARLRPIETILSGPAASLTGAHWLSGAETALVSDIGGTTTDVAVLTDGRPALDPDGARIGRWQTMVEAVRLRTTGLGGDSEVHQLTEGLDAGLRLGPRRVMPVALLAADHPALVHATLDRQLVAPAPREHDARFAVAVARPGAGLAGLDDRAQALFAALADGPRPLEGLIQNRLTGIALERLVARGLVLVSALTPTDASHVLGRHDAFDRAAAEKATTLFARRRTNRGNRLAADAETLAQMILDQLTDQTAEVLMETALEADGFAPGLAGHPLLHAGLRGHAGHLALSAHLAIPVIGLGASARNYYTAVGERLGAATILPEAGGVANAIGAVVGGVEARISITVSAPEQGRFRLHLSEGVEDFANEQDALTAAETAASTAARLRAAESGAEEAEVSVSRQVSSAEVEGQRVFIEAEITATARGRPRLAVAGETA